MEELVCRRSRGPEVDVSRIIIAAMGAMAALSPKDFKAFLGGDSAPLKARLPRCILESESAGIRAFCRDARQAVTSLRAARQWCAERLHEILSNRLPAGKREAEALIPLMRLAGPAIFDSDPDRGWDGQLIARYRHGLAEVVRHAAHLVVSAPSPMERWHAHLIDCLLGARDLGIPPWCQKLFRHATGSVGGTPTTDGDPDAIRRVLDGADLRRDALEHWVDPSAPISACTVALWLGRYLKLDVAGLHALDAVVPPGPQSALTRLVLAIVAQRLAAVASELDGQPTESPGFTQEIEDLLLHMISEVAYHDGRVPRRLRIGWLLRQAERYEITLYSLGGYRDHLYHVINVASLGILLDDMKLLASGKSHRLRGQALGDWLLAGLCHDLGYGLRPLLRGAHDLEPFLRAGLDHSLCDAIGSSIRDFLRQANNGAQ
ncbi:hypothetical protein HQ560_07375, partial [bacterium]|nr:hypothetical protein [bacterium]